MAKLISSVVLSRKVYYLGVDLWREKSCKKVTERCVAFLYGLELLSRMIGHLADGH